MYDEQLTNYYNQFGFITIPLIPNEKRPYIKEWQKLKKSKKIRITEQGIKDNIGVLTGKVSNIIVVDIDSDGIKIWKKWIKQFGDIDTPITKTGDGLHIFFKYDKDIKNKIKIEVSNKKVGIDVYTDGKQVVLPPSVHPNGKKYKWLKSPDKYEIIEIPDWLKLFIK